MTLTLWALQVTGVKKHLLDSEGGDQCVCRKEASQGIMNGSHRQHQLMSELTKLLHKGSVASQECTGWKGSPKLDLSLYVPSGLPSRQDIKQGSLPRARWSKKSSELPLLEKSGHII